MHHNRLLCRHGQSERQRTPSRNRLETFCRHRRDGSEVDRFTVGGGFGIEAREPQQIFNNAAHSVRLSGDPLQRGACCAVGPSMRSDVSAWMTDSGVRNSWEASAVKSRCRWRMASMGPATRRPMANEPAKTAASSKGPTISSVTSNVDIAWVTEDMLAATTARVPFGCAWPPTRTSVPAMVAVV